MADTRGPLCMLQACVPPQRFLHAERDHLYYLCPPPYLSIRGKRCTLVATTQPSLATRVLRLRTYAMAEAGIVQVHSCTLGTFTAFLRGIVGGRVELPPLEHRCRGEWRLAIK